MIIMKKLTTILFALVIAGCIVTATCSCSYVSSSFVDTDGTNYSTTLWLAPFSKLDGKTASMAYKWSGESGDIKVGEGIQGLDQTRQVEVMQAAIAAAITAALARTTIPPVPALEEALPQ